MLKTILVFLAIGLFGVLLYFMPIQIRFKIRRKDENDLIIIRYRSFYGVINLKFELPMFDIVFVNGRPALKYKASVKSNRTNKLFKRISKIFTGDDFNHIKKYLRGDKVLLKRIEEYWLKHIVLRDLSIITRFGFFDAAFTAALCGITWTIVGTILSIMKNSLDMTIKKFIVSPIFDKESLEVEISCIINFRLGDIINTGILVIKRRKELKREKLSQDAPVSC